MSWMPSFMLARGSTVQEVGRGSEGRGRSNSSVIFCVLQSLNVVLASEQIRRNN